MAADIFLFKIYKGSCMSQTPEEINIQTKNALIQAFNKFQNDTIQFLARLSLDPQMKIHCFQNLDQASFWAIQAITALELKVMPVTPAAIIDPPAKTEEKPGTVVLDSLNV